MPSQFLPYRKILEQPLSRLSKEVVSGNYYIIFKAVQDDIPIARRMPLDLIQWRYSPNQQSNNV